MTTTLSATSWCLTCDDRATLIFLNLNVGPNDVWECGRGHRFSARRCPTCGHLGREAGVVGRHECTNSHAFWAATKFCECGQGVPVCPDDGDRVWVCEACDRWEVAS